MFNGESPKGFPANLVKVARRKLRYLNAAADLGDLTSPPGNRLEALAGDRKGNTRSGSTTNSECALFGRPKARQRSRSWTRGGRVKKETPFAWGTPIAAPRIERSAGLPNGRSLVASRQSDPGCDDRS